jgi:hypothetical protein
MEILYWGSNELDLSGLQSDKQGHCFKVGQNNGHVIKRHYASDYIRNSCKQTFSLKMHRMARWISVARRSSILDRCIVSILPPKR